VKKLIVKLQDLETRIETSTGRFAGMVQGTRANVESIDAGTRTEILEVKNEIGPTKGVATGLFAEIEAEIESFGPRSEIFQKLDRLIDDEKTKEAVLGGRFSTIEGQVEGIAPDLIGRAGAIVAEIENQNSYFETKRTLVAGEAQSREQTLRQKLEKKKPIFAKDPSTKAEFDAIEGALRAARAQFETTCEKAQRSVSGQNDALKKEVEGAKRSAMEKIEPFREGLEASYRSILSPIEALRKEIEEKKKSLQKAAQEAANAIGAPLTPALKTILDALHGLEPPLDAAGEEVKKIGDGARETLGKTLREIEAEVRSKGAAFLEEVRKARKAVEKAQEEIRKIAKGAADAIDALLKGAHETVKGIIAQVDATIEGAEKTLFEIEATIQALRAKMRAGLKLLEDKIAQLKTLANQLLASMRNFLALIVSLLDAIPAEGLPKPVVKTSMAAIDQVLADLTGQITAAAQQASNQLKQLTKTIAQQIEQGGNKLVQEIETFRKEARNKINAVLTPVKQQVALFRQNLKAAVTQAIAQIDPLETTAMKSIESAREAIRKQIDAVIATIEKALGAAEEAVSTAIKGVNEKIEAAKKRMADLVAAATGPARQSLKTLRTEAQTKTAEARSALKAARDRALSGVNEAEKTLRQELEALARKASEKLDELAPAVQKFRDGLGKPFDALRKKAQDTSFVDEQVNLLRAEVKRAYDPIEARIDAMKGPMPSQIA
jgi:predicted  nucleic acid-binding Zn-ribbon protein